MFFLSFLSSSISQTSFAGLDFYFDSGICDSLIIDDGEEFLLLTSGYCDDKVLVNFAPTNSFRLETSGIYWSDSSKINLKLSSGIEDIEVIFEKVPMEEKILIYLSSGHFSKIKTSYGEEMLSELIDTIRITGYGDFPEEEISLNDLIFYSENNNSYLSLIFAGVPEITANQDSFYMSWLTIKLNSYLDSIDNIELAYSSINSITAIVGLNSQVEKFDIFWSPTEIKAGTSEIISGVNLDQLDGIFLNNEQVDFLLIDSSSIRVDWPDILPEYGDLIFVGTINSYLEKDVPLEEPFLTPIFDDFTSILFEDSSYTLYLKWEDPDLNFIGNYRIEIKEHYNGEGLPPELYQNTIITTDKEIILTGLPLGDGFRVRLGKYNEVISNYILSDVKFLRHEITSGESFMIAAKPYAILRNWVNDSSDVDLVTFFYYTPNHPTAVRAFLQKINNGLGFNDSSKPWFSNEGTIINLITSTLPDEPDDPDDPPTPDGNQDRGCICQLYQVAEGLHSEDKNSQDGKGGEDSYINETWLSPRVYKHIGISKSNHNRWMRNQRLGAANYREVFTQINSGKGTRYNYFLNYDHEDAHHIPADAMPGQAWSKIQIVLSCFAIKNGQPHYSPCVDICKTSAHLQYSYNSRHFAEFKKYKKLLNTYARTYASDEAFLIKTHNRYHQLVDEELIWAGFGAVEDHCESSFNTSFIKAYGSYVAKNAAFINFDSLGLSFDPIDLFVDEENINELFGAIAHIVETPFINRTGHCDETSRKSSLITRDARKFHFELGHADEFVFTLYSTQSIASRVLRSRARTKIATDFHLLLNIGDLGYTANKYIENRDSCCIWSQSLYLIGSHDTLYVGKNGVPFPANPKFIESNGIVFGTFGKHRTDIRQNIPQQLLVLNGDTLPSDKNHLHSMFIDYIHCAPNTPLDGGSSTGGLISNTPSMNIFVII